MPGNKTMVRDEGAQSRLEAVRDSIDALRPVSLSEFFKFAGMARNIEEILGRGQKTALRVSGDRYSIYLQGSRIIIEKNGLDQFEPEYMVLNLDAKNQIMSMEAYAGGSKFPATNLEIYDFFEPAKNLINLGALVNFSISEEELLLAASGRAGRLALAKRIIESGDSRWDFPPPKSVDAKKTKTVLQGQCRIMDASSESSLYCEYAKNCAIVIVKAINPFTKEVQKVAMAHIDPKTTSLEIGEIYDALGGNSTETCIIGPRADLALKICVVAAQKGSQLKFVSADMRDLVEDAAMVKSGGEIYYGKIEGISDSGAAIRQDEKMTYSKNRGFEIKVVK